MRKIFKGYTLAEVLVCVAIVGICAALVAPALFNNTRSAVNINSVARAVELVQNGMVNIMQTAQNNSDDDAAPANLASIQLSDLFEDGGDDYITDDDNLFSETMAYMNIERAEDYNINNIIDYSGDEIGGEAFADMLAYRFKKNNAYIIVQSTTQDGIADAADDDVITRILIDANGPAAPNQIGRDVFLFGLANNGQMVPAGSEAYNNNLFAEELPLYTDEDNGCMENITDGLPCAARIMADGWAMNY